MKSYLFKDYLTEILRTSGRSNGAFSLGSEMISAGNSKFKTFGETDREATTTTTTMITKEKQFNKKKQQNE